MRSTDASSLVLDTLGRRLDRWAPPRPWAVGVSGGRDSAVLLWALSRLTEPSSLTALHVDHGWRPAEERLTEGLLVQELCRALEVPLRAFPPPERVERTEAGARAWRYAAFEKWLEGSGGGTVFLAHHRDDQAETVLMRLLQGRSWQGLGGIPARRGPFVRPLLTLRRADLAAAAGEQNLPFHEDSTNAFPDTLRNFLRLEVFPRLGERFPAAPRSLEAFARRWAALVPRPVRDAVWTATDTGWSVEAAVWDGWPAAVREAQLLACRDSAGSPRLSRRFLEALTVSGRLRAAQGQGHRWSRTAERVFWERVVQAPVKEYFIQVNGPGVARLPGGGAIRGSFGPEGTLVPGLDPVRPWSVRSADALDGNSRRRRKLLTGRSAADLAVIGQDGRVLAVADTRRRCLIWLESEPEKLNNRGIFVSLE